LYEQNKKGTKIDKLVQLEFIINYWEL